MVIGYIWVIFISASVLLGAATGRAEAVGAAAVEGAGAAVTLVVSIAGIICLWSGIMEVMKRSGLMSALSRLLHPALRLLFPASSKNSETLEALAANMSANLLGLGNAATPAGIKAALGMLKNVKNATATNELCRLVVINTASLQLLPTTVAGIRAAAGAESAFDILPAVWITSAVALAAGLLTSLIFQRFHAE